MSGRPAQGRAALPAPSAARVAWAGWATSAALLVLALPMPGARPEPCLHPAEVAARDGRSVEVACRADPAVDAVRGPARLLFGLSIDLNRADLPTLEALPGIGPARARAIVRERERRPFGGPGELMRVRGIGPRTLERLAGFVAVVDTRRRGGPGGG